MAFASGQGAASSFAQRAGAASTTGTHPPSQETEVLTVFLFLKLRRENLPSATLALQPQELPDVGLGHMGSVLIKKVASGHDAP